MKVKEGTKPVEGRVEAGPVRAKAEGAAEEEGADGRVPAVADGEEDEEVLGQGEEDQGDSD